MKNNSHISKNLLYIFLIVFLFLANSVFLIYKISRINNWRKQKSTYLYETAVSSQNTNKKLINLIKSNVLNPTEQKKIEIADIYLREHDYSAAKFYLIRLKSNEGILKFTESAVENRDYVIVDTLSVKLSDEQKNEISIFKDISDDENAISRIDELPVSPSTNLGNLLKAINTNDFSIVSDKTLLGWDILRTITATEGSLRRDLNISQALLSNNQPILARHMLKRIIELHPNLAETHEKMALSYVMRGDYKNALIFQLNVVRANPGNIAVYEKALNYAQRAGDSYEVQWLNDNISYLKKIQK